jgi:hypothetical protein
MATTQRSSLPLPTTLRHDLLCHPHAVSKFHDLRLPRQLGVTSGDDTQTASTVETNRPSGLVDPRARVNRSCDLEFGDEPKYGWAVYRQLGLRNIGVPFKTVPDAFQLRPCQLATRVLG